MEKPNDMKYIKWDKKYAYFKKGIVRDDIHNIVSNRVCVAIQETDA